VCVSRRVCVAFLDSPCFSVNGTQTVDSRANRIYFPAAEISAQHRPIEWSERWLTTDARSLRLARSSRSILILVVSIRSRALARSEIDSALCPISRHQLRCFRGGVLLMKRILADSLHRRRRRLASQTNTFRIAAPRPARLNTAQVDVSPARQLYRSL